MFLKRDGGSHVIYNLCSGHCDTGIVHETYIVVCLPALVHSLPSARRASTYSLFSHLILSSLQDSVLFPSGILSPPELFVRYVHISFLPPGYEVLSEDRDPMSCLIFIL